MGDVIIVIVVGGLVYLDISYTHVYIIHNQMALNILRMIFANDVAVSLRIICISIANATCRVN